MKGAFISVVILLCLKIISAQESYQSIHWQVIILIAALIPIGIVLQKTGTADWIGNNISKFIYLFSADFQPFVLLEPFTLLLWCLRRYHRMWPQP